MNHIFLCPLCKSSFSLPECKCGYNVPYNNLIYRFTDDPYMVKDETADVKYIGYEDIGEYYSGLSLNEKVQVDEQHRKISELVGDGILLDLACGDGAYTIPLVLLKVKTLSMDISDKMLSLLYKRAEIAEIDFSRLVVCRGNALSIPLCDNSVDAVIANSVLHLISKPELVIKEIRRVLKFGGKYFTFEDKPTIGKLNKCGITEEEKANNEKYDMFSSLIHKRYFQKLKSYDINGTRYSWKFDRDQVCREMFDHEETYIIQKNRKIVNQFKDTFLYRMGGKGYSDQSDVPWDIHAKVFEEVMSEFFSQYGPEALNTAFTGYEKDIIINVYIK